MSETKYAHTHCAVQSCRNTVFNKGVDITFHHFPNTPDMKNKWLNALKNRSSTIDWSRSKICSRHFENKHFDSKRQLKFNAVPTLFPIVGQKKNTDNTTVARNKLDRLLNNLTQTELHNDIKSMMEKLGVLEQVVPVTDDLKCHPSASTETQLMLLLKKQDHLITRLMQVVLQNKKHVEVLQKNMQESRAEKKEMEHALENYKYISKCLQEKHATLEEQIEILTAIESRT